MIKTSYISCACNKLPCTVDWGQNNLICYAANNAISIYDPNKNKYGSIISTLYKHTDRINVVKWIKKTFRNFEEEFLSASSDGSVIIWQTDKESKLFEVNNILQMNKPINISDGIYISSNSRNLIICTGTINGDFEIWLRFNNQPIESIQNLNFSKKLPVAARLSHLPNETSNFCNILLLIAIENSTILLYCATSNISDNSNERKVKNFVHMQTLIGHEDWVTSMDCISLNPESLLIASGSQDNTIRLWKISLNKKKNFQNNHIKLKEQTFIVQNQEYEIILESILSGHDAWIYEVHWYPLGEVNEKQNKLKLLSCSLDKSAIIWESNVITGIWSETVRVGEVGGNSLGFYGSKFGPDGNSILTHGYNGSFHIWKYEEETQNWKAQTAPNGHSASVTDLCWDPKGRFLISVSTDKTTRIHAPLQQDDEQEFWHEIGRPQIHGYDMSCVAILKSYMFASGAEEKVARVFTAPVTFKNYLQKITNDISDFNEMLNMAETASIPTLGLTNKANNNEYFQYPQDKYFKDLNVNVPPIEEELIRFTLWPEKQKLYGHGYEIFSMAARHDGTLLATSCKSTSQEHAVIILWNTETWFQSQNLSSHQLTVTQMAFSPNDKHLVSVSRDRRWSLFSLQGENYELIVISTKKYSFHTRIIWCCAWTTDSEYFATGSRDGKIGVWSHNINESMEVSPVTKIIISDNSITSLAFTILNYQGTLSYVLAIGYEDGCIDLRTIYKNSHEVFSNWKQLAFLNQSNAHHLTVRRLAFRPKNCKKNVLQLASCGNDGMVKIYDIQIK